jgi:hypothetical protein
MTIVETRPITGGVDRRLDTHVAAALDVNGGVLGIESSRRQRRASVRCTGGWPASGRSLVSAWKPPVWKPPAPLAPAWRGTGVVRGSR